MENGDKIIKVSPDAKEAPRFIYGKGWSLMNILIGFAFAIGGWFLLVAPAVILGFNFLNGSPVKLPEWALYLWEGICLVLVAVGTLGFWLVIPAFQKWWNTKRWLAWTFLGIALFIVYITRFLRIY